MRAAMFPCRSSQLLLRRSVAGLTSTTSTRFFSLEPDLRPEAVAQRRLDQQKWLETTRKEERDLAIRTRTTRDAQARQVARGLPGGSHRIADGTSLYDRTAVKNALAHLGLVLGAGAYDSLDRVAGAMPRGLGSVALVAFIDWLKDIDVAANAADAAGGGGGAAPGDANSIDGFFSRIFNIERWGKGEVLAVPEAELYVVITASCQELPDVERLWRTEGAKGKLVVLFNLKLDTQRGDLGLPAFPRKALQHRFLSYVRPAYFLRSRSYSLSLRRPPFLLPFSGALFRAYPGPYQCLLDTGNGRYRLVQTDARRPALGEFKEALRQALKVDVADKGKASDVLTRGYKTKTWFEEDAERLDESEAWRS